MGEAEGAGHWMGSIVECADTGLYTGITNNLDRRLAEHAAGKGAKYTKGRGPFRLVYRATCQGRGEASRRETTIQSLTRVQKRQRCSGNGHLATDIPSSGPLAGCSVHRTAPRPRMAVPIGPAVSPCAGLPSDVPRHLREGVPPGMLQSLSGISPPSQAGGEAREWSLVLFVIDASGAVMWCIPADISRRGIRDL